MENGGRFGDSRVLDTSFSDYDSLVVYNGHHDMTNSVAFQSRTFYIRPVANQNNNFSFDMSFSMMAVTYAALTGLCLPSLIWNKLNIIDNYNLCGGWFPTCVADCRPRHSTPHTHRVLNEQ